MTDTLRVFVALIGCVALLFGMVFGAVAYIEGEREESFRVCVEADNPPEECK